MSLKTKIAWADSTVNPVMGCDGCELFLKPDTICKHIDAAIRKTDGRWKPGEAKQLLVTMSDDAYRRLKKPRSSHSRELTTTNIWHLRDAFAAVVREKAGLEAGSAAMLAIEHGASCYAARLHFNRGSSIVNPGRDLNPGYSEIFTQVTTYPARMQKMANSPDLLHTCRDDKPWLDGLPRLIFVSDMGDAFSEYKDRRAFLESDAMTAINSEKGRRHFWLWLTKRPALMAEFSTHIGGFPEHVCAMTTLLDGTTATLTRLKQLKRVKAHVRGLSIEPLLARIDPAKLDLEGIHWVIVGGESGDNAARPFDLLWARDIRDACKDAGVACFIKQLGRKPMVDGEPLHLKLDKSHGGDWDEWPDDLKVREMPEAFKAYRSDEEVVIESRAARGLTRGAAQTVHRIEPDRT